MRTSAWKSALEPSAWPDRSARPARRSLEKQPPKTPHRPTSHYVGWSGGFALFPRRCDPGWRVRLKRGFMVTAERNPEQLEDPAADLLLRRAQCLRVGDHQLI